MPTHAIQPVGGTATSAALDDDVYMDVVDSTAPLMPPPADAEMHASASASPAQAPPGAQAARNAHAMQSFMLRKASAELAARSQERAEGRSSTRPTTHDRNGEGSTCGTETQATPPGTRARQGRGAGGPLPHGSGGKGKGKGGGGGRGGARDPSSSP